MNSVLVIVILSFALTYLWTYYREKAAEMEKAAIPGAPPAKTTGEWLADYRREQESIKELSAQNEEEMAGLSSNSPRFLGYGDMDVCYRIRYDPDLPTGHPQLNGRAPVEIGRELDEECAARQQKTEEQYRQIRESDHKQRYNDKLMKRSAYAARLGDLDQKIAAAQKRLDTGFFGVALEAGFYRAFFPIFVLVTMLNFFRLYLKKKIAEPLSPV